MGKYDKEELKVKYLTKNIKREESREKSEEELAQNKSNYEAQYKEYGQAMAERHKAIEVAKNNKGSITETNVSNGEGLAEQSTNQMMKPAEQKKNSTVWDKVVGGVSGLIDGLVKHIDMDQLKEWELASLIPQKPEYLSKKDMPVIYLSRYSNQILKIDPQMTAAVLGILMGVVAIVLSIPTGGMSVYLAIIATAGATLGAMQIVISVKELEALNEGKTDIKQRVFGIDQEDLNNMGIILGVVSLSMLAKHGILKLSDKFVNTRNVVALEEIA
ncbi:hypothetical protein, partial [Cohnella terricola]|uniref:hypothetical protein n=1 Tax=Cohnella terricola TaxID=1289167 RepID=UPI0016458457